MKPINSRGEIINEIPVESPQKTTFDLSYGNTGTGQIGRLIPVNCKELLPADVLRLNAATLLRFEPLAVPITGRMKMRHHSFAVPYRQVWNKFDTFITGGKGNTDRSNLPSISLRQMIEGAALMIGGRHPILGVTDLDASQLGTFENLYTGALSNYSDVFYSKYPHLTANFDILFDVACKIFAFRTGASIESAILRLEPRYKRIVSFWLFYRIFEDVAGNGSLWDYLGYPTWSAGLEDDLLKGVEYTVDLSALGSRSSNYQPVVRFSLVDMDSLAFSKVLYSDVAVSTTTTTDESLRAIYNSEIYQDFGELIEFFAWLAEFAKSINNPIIPMLDAYFFKFHLSASDGWDEDDNGEVQFALHQHSQADILYSVLPLRAFARVWYYYYRDQNLDFDDDPDNYVGDVPTSAEISRYMILPPVCWRKDLFNTATLQAYQTNMVVPLSNDADPSAEARTIEVYNPETGGNETMDVPTSWLSRLDPQNEQLIAHGLSGLSLQNLKKCEMLAKWLDKALYLGWTYADRLSSSFAVRYSDARLQLPEYLGGSAQDIDISVLTNTTTTSEQLAGDQTAYAQGLNQMHCDDYFSEEHQVIFTFVSVVPTLTYPHAVDKMLLRQNKFDFPWPEFANLGQDLVTCGEVATHPFKNQGSAEDLFAYQSRYYDQKASINVQHGAMNRELRMYTFGRSNEDAKPELNAGFVHCVPSTEMFVSANQWQFIYDTYNKIYVNRCLPAFERVL